MEVEVEEEEEEEEEEVRKECGSGGLPEEEEVGLS